MKIDYSNAGGFRKRQLKSAWTMGVALLCIVLCASVHADTTNGLVAWFPLDGDVTDASGSGFNCISNNVTYVADRYGHANASCNFNGTNSYLRVPQTLTGGNPFTWSAWIKLDALTTNTCFLLTQGGNPGAGTVSPSILLNSPGYPTGSIRFNTQSGVENNLVSGVIPWSTNDWYHIAVASDSGGNRCMFINGVCVAITNAQAFGQILGNFYIGANVAYNEYGFKGSIDDVRVYNRSLTAADIRELTFSINWRESFNEPFTSLDLFSQLQWFRTDASINVDEPNGVLHIGNGGGNDSRATKGVGLYLPAVVEVRCRLVSGGEGYYLPAVAFFTPSNAFFATASSGGWTFGVNPSFQNAGSTKLPSAENQWRTVKIVAYPTEGFLYAKSDGDADFSFINRQTWTIGASITNIELRQNWDSICDFDYVKISTITRVASGNVNYSGRQTGNILILAATNSSSWSSAHSASIRSTGSYSVTIHSLVSASMWLRAFRDSNGNGIRDSFEAWGEYANNPVLLINDVVNINLALADPDTDGDEMPDWWELKYFTDLTSAVTNQDIDSDGLDNLHEAWAGADPRNPDTDGDGMPDGWEGRYGLNLNSPMIFGRGTDGDLSVPAGTTYYVDAVKTAVSGSNLVGNTAISVSSTNGFRSGDTILVIAMQDPNMDMNQNAAGVYEFGRISGVNSNSLILAYPLSNSYIVVPSRRVQAMRVPEYSSVTVSGMLSCASWDGLVGGVLAFMANRVSMAPSGIITSSGRGFRGGSSVDGSVGTIDYGIAGEGSTGWSTNRATGTLGYIQGGGGAGLGADASGGGGGFGTSGNNGTFYWAGPPSSAGGQGASAFGSTSLSRVFMGGGGGGSGASFGGRVGVGGGAGGGIIIAVARTISGIGVIASCGTNGSNGTYAYDSNSGAGGGGGAGGSIMIDVTSITGITVLATGGNGGIHHPAGVGKDGGGGGVGRIRINTAVDGILPSCIPLAGYTGVLDVAGADYLSDLDNDGLTAFQEFQWGACPTNADTENDGMPDGWEVANGLNPTNNDASADFDTDGLNNAIEFMLGAKANNANSDNDGIPDGDEYLRYGSDPTIDDTDNDGMPDGWEVAHGLNPLVNDANEDRDLDGVPNLMERQQGLNPNQSDSMGNGTNDFRRIYVKEQTAYSYDKIDRLTGVVHSRGSNGFSIAYVYDGNGNILRQVYLQRDQNGNGIPDLWEFQNGLSYTNANDTNSAYADPDGDGWSNYQEWQAKSNPTNANITPDFSGLAGITAGVFQVGFTPSNFVMGVGQLDGQGGDEVVIGADGNPGNWTNCIWILEQSTPGNWTTQHVDVGNIGITSIAIGQPTNALVPAVYLGTRQSGDSGSVIEIFRSKNGWTKSILPLGNIAGDTFVWGVNNGSLWANIGTSSGSLVVAMSSMSNNWAMEVVESLSSPPRNGLVSPDWPASSPTAVACDTNTIRMYLSNSGILTQGLVSYYTFDDLGGGAVKDSYASIHGTVSGDLTYGVTGKIGTAVSFDGITRISFPNMPNATNGQDWSISTWVRDGGSGSSSRLWAVGTASYQNYFSPGSSGMTFHTDNSDETGDDWDISTVPAGWYHVVFGVQHYGGGYYKYIYVNGSVNQKQVVGKTAREWSGQFSLGRLVVESQWYSGKADEMGVWFRALTSNDVQVLYNEGKGFSIMRNNYSASSIAVSDEVGKIADAPNNTAFSYVRGQTPSIFRARSYDTTEDGRPDSWSLKEYQGSNTSWSLVFQTNITKTSYSTFPLYAVAGVNFVAGKASVLFASQPDGSVFSWTALSTTGSLQCQLFSSFYTGRAWHKMGSLRSWDGGEWLMGLMVDPTNPTVCNVIGWAPQRELWQPPSVSQNPPDTRIMPDPSTGAGVSLVKVKIWDAEGNSSLPMLQYSLNGIAWSNATVASVDGRIYSLTMSVTAMPDGMVHDLLWQSASDLGTNFNGVVQVRARSCDNSGYGNWSEVVSYTVTATDDSNHDGIPDAWCMHYGLDPLATNGNSHANGSADGTDVDNLYKYIADLDPTNPASRLELTGISILPQGVRVDWKGGRWATQYLEICQSLGNTSEQWVAIFTNTPPTSTATNIIDAGSTNTALFYRIKAGR